MMELTNDEIALVMQHSDTMRKLATFNRRKAAREGMAHDEALRYLNRARAFDAEVRRLTTVVTARHYA
jgi:hypothetical protein